MNSKIKIGLIVLFIVVFFILLRIRKIESYSKNFPYHSLTKSIELFSDSGKNLINIDVSEFRKDMVLHGEGDIYKDMNNNPNPIVIPINKATGSCFDTRNDDLIIIDSYRLLRATTRPQRFTSDTNRKPQFNIKLDVEIVDSGYKTDTDILIKMMIAINEKLKLKLQNINNIITNPENFEAVYDILKTKINNLETFEPLLLELNEIETVDSLKDTNTKKYTQKSYKDNGSLLSDLDFLKNSYLRGNAKCSIDKSINCRIPYQRDIAPFSLGNNKYGIHELEYGGEGSSQANKVDHPINPENNKWNQSLYKGVFQPHIEGFADLSAQKVSSNYKVEDKYDNIGVGMLYDDSIQSVLVPDTYNNRIQVMNCEKKDFYYQGQFGNLEYATARSFPTFEGTDTDRESTNNPLLNAALMYEPIVYVDDNKKYAKNNYDCNSIDFSNGATGTDCDNNSKLQRADIHSRNELTDYADNKLLGHFNSLRTEYNRVTKELFEESDVNSKLKGEYYNPTSIGIKEATLAYRKILYKAIKIADEGQKFGQLFRPKSIAYDDDYDYRNGSKYYVVDTYHHCIQCFEKPTKINTQEGEEYSFVSADKDLNDNEDIYLYDEEMNLNNNYNTSRMYSLGVRQKVIYVDKEEENNNINDVTNDYKTLYNTEQGKEWAKNKNAQIKNGKPIVKLYRWLSGKGGTTNLPQFYKKQDKKEPGLGEFLYPTDIAITNNPFSKEKLLLVTDMGNNRVVIFKKYKIGDSHYRFRFYDFLTDIKFPISITVCNNTGTVYVLEVDGNNKNIKCYKPSLQGGLLKYVPKSSNDINTGNKAIKIRIDDRGIIAVTKKEGGIELVPVLKEIQDLFELETTNKRLNSVYFNLKLKKSVFEKKINELPNNIQRFRIVLERTNKSQNSKNDVDAIVSPEFRLDYNINEKGSLYTNQFYNNYTINDTIQTDNYQNYWVTTNGFMREKVPIDLIDRGANPTQIYVSTKYNHINKNYMTRKYNGNINRILENYEDWVGKGIEPNTTYQYKIGIYNYFNYKEIISDAIITTPPLGITSGHIERDINNGNVTLKISYGEISALHYQTQKNNPLYMYILRKEHNRTRDISTKYININTKQFIQIIVPGESKYIYDKESQPKFGKLYVFNALGNGSVEEQNQLMEKGKYYKNENLVIYYCANGGITGEGGYGLPSKRSLKNSNEFYDFFTLGDDPKTIHKKVKFRVKINLDSNLDKNTIELSNPNNINSLMLDNYSRKDDISSEHSMKLLTRTSLLKIDSGKYDYAPMVEYEDKTTLSNRTYEYCVLIGNQFTINQAVNSFYVTTSPPKALFNEKPLEEVSLVDNGVKKLYLKIEWYTAKNDFIYWPYNFLVLRRVKPDTPTKPNYKEPESNKGRTLNAENFSISNGKIRLKIGIKTPQIYKHRFGNTDGDRRVLFRVYGPNADKTKYTIKYNGKTEGGTWNKKKPVNKGVLEIPKAYNIELHVTLEKGQTLENIELRETVIFTGGLNTQEESNLRNTAIEKHKIERHKELKALEEYNKKLEQKNYINQQKKNIAKQRLGPIFMKKDDYEDVETSHYKGNGGELYLYLKNLNKEELLDIFDSLQDKILSYHGDVTMKMEGPGGMLRSGGKDMLIDKIRHMAQILRKGYQDTLKALDMECSDSNVSMGKPKCVSKAYLEKQKSKAKDLINKENKISNAKEEVSSLVSELNTLKSSMGESKLSESAEIQNLQNKLEDAKKEEKELETGIGEVASSEELQPQSSTDSLITPELTSYLDTLKSKLEIGKIEKGKGYNNSNFGLGDSGIYDEVPLSDLEDLKSYLSKMVLFKDGALKEGTGFKDNYSNLKNIILNIKEDSIVIKFYEGNESVNFNREKVIDDENSIILYINEEPQKSKEELTTENKDIVSDLETQINELKAKKNDEKDPDIVRLEEIKKQIEENNSLIYTDWSCLGQGKSELMLPNYLKESDTRQIVENYGIIPTLGKLASHTKKGKDLFKGNLSNKIKEREYIPHKQLVPISGKDRTEYEYCVLTYPTGFNFNTESKRGFMGLKYQQLEISNTNDLPKFNVGASFSNIVTYGEETHNKPPKEVVESPSITITQPPAEMEPIIKSFSPKEGLQGSVVKVIGVDLDKIEYFCFRDIKSVILKRGKTIVDNVEYDEVLLRVPTLKELGKECWQSLRPYEVLVWGYYKGGGKQIRTDEVKNKDNSKAIKSVLMFRYMDRTECPDGQKLSDK